MSDEITSNPVYLYIDQMNRVRFDKLKQYRSRLKQLNDHAKFLSKILVKKIQVSESKPNLDPIIAVDGSMYQHKYEAISISVASAFVFLSNSPIEKFIPDIQLIPPYDSHLVTMLNMRGLEYKVAKNLLVELVEEEKFSISPENLLVLFDGPLTFPDTDILSATNADWIKDTYELFNKRASELFQYSDKHNIPIAGIVKESQANKLMPSLAKYFFDPSADKNYQEIDFNNFTKEEQIEYFLDWLPRINSSEVLTDVYSNDYIKKKIRGIQLSEMSLINRLFKEKEKVTDYPLRTVFVNVNIALRKPPSIKVLEKGVIGFYLKPVKFEKPFFVEVPCNFIPFIENIINKITLSSRWSIIPGYPLPLYLAHKGVKNRNSLSKRIARLVRTAAWHELKEEGFDDVFIPIFRKKID